MPKFALHLQRLGEAHTGVSTPTNKYRMLITRNDDHLCGKCAHKLDERHQIVQVTYVDISPKRFCDNCGLSR